MIVKELFDLYFILVNVSENGKKEGRKSHLLEFSNAYKTYNLMYYAIHFHKINDGDGFLRVNDCFQKPKLIMQSLIVSCPIYILLYFRICKMVLSSSSNLFHICTLMLLFLFF